MADAPAMSPASADQLAGAGLPTREAGSRRSRRARAYAALLPFFLYVSLFLFLPTLIVAVGAFQDAQGGLTLANVEAVLGQPSRIEAFSRSLWLSIVTAIGGAIFGALLAWAVAGGKPDGVLRQLTVSVSGVLAQFGGVMLAFGFVATFGLNALVPVFLQNVFHIDVLKDSLWLYSMTGLALVYLYFQIPLMLIVFLPAIDGLRKEWREASVSLGGSSWDYWRHVGGPILAPSFFGAVLLLFTNSFSAYATAAALVSQGSPIVTLQIRNALTSETVLGQENVGKALALGMILIVALVMSLYALLQRRTSRWLR